VVLELGDDDLVALRESPAHGLGDQAEAVGGAAGEDDLVPARGPPMNRCAESRASS